SVIGFDTHSPHMHYRRMPYGKFGVRIKTPEPTYVVIRLDNLVIEHRAVDPRAPTITCTSDGKPFVFAAPGTRIAPAPAEQSGVEEPSANAAAEQSTTPDFLAPLPLAPSHGLVIVSVRFVDIKPEHAPELPPDDFSHVCLQMNEHHAHLQAAADNIAAMIGPARIP